MPPLARDSDADVVIVNHALACLDLGAEGNVLPEHDVLVVDEAHALAEAATRSFGVDLAPSGIRRLAAMLKKHGAPAKAVDAITRGTEHLEGLLGDLDGERLLGDVTHGHKQADIEVFGTDDARTGQGQ